MAKIVCIKRIPSVEHWMLDTHMQYAHDKTIFIWNRKYGEYDDEAECDKLTGQLVVDIVGKPNKIDFCRVLHGIYLFFYFDRAQTHYMLCVYTHAPASHRIHFVIQFLRNHSIDYNSKVDAFHFILFFSNRVQHNRTSKQSAVQIQNWTKKKKMNKIEAYKRWTLNMNEILNLNI